MSIVTEGMQVLAGMQAERCSAEVLAEHPEWSPDRQLAEVMRRSKGAANPALVRELLGKPHRCSERHDPRHSPWWSVEYIGEGEKR